MDPRQYPVLWHQALLTFVQRYKNDMSPEQRDLFLDLCNSQQHRPRNESDRAITPLIRYGIGGASCALSDCRWR